MSFRGWSRSLCAVALLCGLAGWATKASAADAGLAPAAKGELEALLAGITGETKFVRPGPAIDPSALKGKLIFTIPTSTAIPFCDVVDKQMDEFAQKLGVRHEVWQTTAQLGQWVQGFNTAFAHKADLINVACGLDPATVAPASVPGGSCRCASCPAR